MDFGIYNTIIQVLLPTDKKVHTKHVRDMAQQCVYWAISNFRYELQRSQIRPGEVMIDLILIDKGDCLEIYKR